MNEKEIEMVDLVHDVERSKRIVRRYYEHQWRKELTKVPIFLIFFVCWSMVIIGLWKDSDLMYSTGFISLFFLIAFLFFCNWRHKSGLNRLMKEMDKQDIASERKFKFGFDDCKIYKETENTNQTVNWKLIKSFEVNEDDVYLFYQNHVLYDIISKEILGEIYFEKFVKMLNEKIKKSD